MNTLSTSLLLLMLAVTGHSYAAQTDTNASLSVTSTAHQFDAPLKPDATQHSAPAPHKLQQQHSEHTQRESNDFWIYDSWVSLQRDSDADGYYSTFSVTLDADTVYNAASVYAIIFVGRNDAYESIYTTSAFTLYGDDSQDAVTIESDLVTGFPPREYHLLIELYDASTHQFVAYSDDYNDADLAFISLESQNHDTRYEETVVIVEEHAGSASLSSLLWLAAAILGIRRRSGASTA